MSTRYVWNRFNITYDTTYTSQAAFNAINVPIENEDVFWTISNEKFQNGPVYFRVGTSCYLNNGRFSISGDTLISKKNGSDAGGNNINTQANLALLSDADLAVYYVGISKTSDNSYERVYVLNIRANSSAALCDISYVRRRNVDYINGRLSDGTSLSGTSYGGIRFLIKGTANGTVSNTSSSTYPLNNDQWQITSIYSIPIVLVRRCANV